MNCCNNNDTNQKKQQVSKKGHMPHMLMMILCCGLPVVLLLLLPFIGSIIPGSTNLLRAIVPFLCPIMMIAMIPMMIKSLKGNKNDAKNSETDKNQLTNGTDQKPDSCH